MFGAHKPAGKGGEHNVLVLDIESSSVGAVLAHLTPGQAPILFAESRINLAVPQRVEGGFIAKQIEKAAHSALEKLSLAAARLRGNLATAKRGEFTQVDVFLSAPWGVPNLAAGKPSFAPSMQKYIAEELSIFAPQTPAAFYTGADAIAHNLLEHAQEQTILAVIVRGETTELLLLGNTGVLGYATLPVGSRSLYRTLQTHAGLTLAEMPAVLTLAHSNNTPYEEPLAAAGVHMLEHFAPSLEALAKGGTPGGVVVVGERGVAEWFARTLESDNSLGALFSPEATIRTWGAHHVARQLGGHSLTPDLHLSLGALFAQAKLQG